MMYCVKESSFVSPPAPPLAFFQTQHRPAAEREEEEQENKPSVIGKSNAGLGGDGHNGHDGADREADEDETAVDEPPTISDRTDAPAQNQQHQNGSSNSGNNSNKKAGRGAGAMGVASDAQLSCPLCFTTVCLECQRHARYSNQFRAVTGINVFVNYDVFLSLDQVSGGGGGGGGKRGRKQRASRASATSAARDIGDGVRRGAQQQPPGGGVRGGGRQGGEEEEVEEEMFHPVCCVECDHRVGVYDAEEIFHFFGVVASG